VGLEVAAGASDVRISHVHRSLRDEAACIAALAELRWRSGFVWAWLIGQDKRGVSALFLARELALRYDTAWLMAHKLRHGLSGAVGISTRRPDRDR